MRGIGVPLIALILVAPVRADENAGKLTLTVSEKAGIRRFGYPVYAKLDLGREVTAKDQFRLLADGKPVEAQFRSLAKVGEKKAVALDFNLSIGPLEKRTFTVEYGLNVTGGPEPKSGLKLERTREGFTIRSGGMVYRVEGGLVGVRHGKKEYLQPRKQKEGAKAPPMTVVREGPLAVCLRIETTGAVAKEGKQRFIVDLTFPRSKSWVEWSVICDDPLGRLETFDARFDLLLEGQRSLVDFGAGTGVYTTLRKDQRAALYAGRKGRPAWEVLTGGDKRLAPFVLPRPGAATLAEGWAHVMDATRATAIAVDDFGKGAASAIEVSGTGAVRITRTIPPGSKGRKAHRFWLHFVDMPVQVGALTSPQSMQSPLVVEAAPAK